SPPAPDAPERLEVARLLDAAGAPARVGSPRIGIHLGAAYGSAKGWPLERVGEFGRLAMEHGAAPVLLGAPADAPAAARVVAGGSGRGRLGGRGPPGFGARRARRARRGGERRHWRRPSGRGPRDAGGNVVRADGSATVSAARPRRRPAASGALRAVLLPRMPD